MPDPSLIKSSTEDALHRLQRFLTNNRRLTFVSCWNASEHESHALWRIYCPTSEGVAIQTTFACLEKSVAPLDVLEVTCNPHELDNILNPYKLATQKRPMFAYEQEVRVVLHQNLTDPEHPDRITYGTGIPWNLEEHIENIWIHPEAQHWFAETVTQIVSHLSPKLAHQVWYSKMNTSPPF